MSSCCEFFILPTLCPIERPILSDPLRLVDNLVVYCHSRNIFAGYTYNEKLYTYTIL